MVLLGLVVAACGAKQQQKPATGNREPATGNARPQPRSSPGESAMAEVLEALRAQTQRMCACSDADCVEQAEADQFEWGFTHKELVDRAHGTPDQNHEADALIEQTETCSHKLRP